MSQTVNFNGNMVTSDSFNSTNSSFSTNGRYDPAKAVDHGDIWTTSSLSNAMSLGNAQIKGTLHAAPGGGVTLGPNGSVGDLSWVSGGQTGIQMLPPHLKFDANQAFPDATLPDTGLYGWLTAVPGTYNIQLDDGTTGTFRYLINNNTGTKPFWRIANLDGSLFVKGAVTLDVTTTANFNGQIYISTNSGVFSSLTMYVEAPSFTVSGNGVVNSQGSVKNFQYIGLPSNTLLSLSANTDFIGQIYAPEADLTISGGGSATYNFSGSAVVKSATVNGSFNFHFDEAVGSNFRLVAPMLTISNDYQFIVMVQGALGVDYTLQASTDLANWTSLTTHASPYTYFENNATNFMRRFYRAVFVP